MVKLPLKTIALLQCLIGVLIHFLVGKAILASPLKLHCAQYSVQKVTVWYSYAMISVQYV